MSEFTTQYGPWALVAGGAQGIGEAWVRRFAAAGLDIIAVDLSGEALQSLERQVRDQHGVDFVGVELDLARSDMLERVVDAVGAREVGMLVYNAGLADVGPFYKAETGLDYELRKLAINVGGPLQLTYHFAKPMLRRGRGGVVLMASGTGLNGAPYYAHYAATKAYDIVLAESLWGEFKPCGVDVLAVVAGMTLSTAAAGYAHLDTSTFQTPAELVDEALGALGHTCSVICGEAQREGRRQLRELPRERRVEALARHAIDNFLGGAIPQQQVDR